VVPGDPSHPPSARTEGGCEPDRIAEASLDQSKKFQGVSEPDASVVTVTTGDVGPSGQGSVSTCGAVEPFEEFMEREWKLVVALLYGLTRDWYAAEDLAQNAFAAAEQAARRPSRASTSPGPYP
jgi:hypothetical protein